MLETQRGSHKNQIPKGEPRPAASAIARTASITEPRAESRATRKFAAAELTTARSRLSVRLQAQSPTSYQLVESGFAETFSASWQLVGLNSGILIAC
jgi:hypothetical protein